MIRVIGVMGVDGTLGIPAKEALRSERLRSESPMVLPSVSVITTLVADEVEEPAADWAWPTGPVRAWKITVVWP